MKIGILTSMSGVGGTEHVSTRLASLLRRKGHSVKLISGPGPLVEEAVTPDNWWNIDFYGNTVHYCHSIGLLRARLHAEPLDLLHCQMARPVLGSVIANGFSGRRAKIVWHSRGLEAKTYPLVCRMFDNLGVFAIGNCRHEQEKLIRHGYRSARTAFTYNPLPRTLKLELSPKTDDLFTLGSLARLSKDRRVDEAIFILSELRMRRQNARLLIAGAGPERESLEHLTRHLGLTDSVEFIGVVRHLPDFFSKIDVLVNVPMAVGDAGAGVGNNVLEAAQFKVPVVTYDACGISEMVLHGRTGYCVEVGDRDAFVGHLCELANSRLLRSSFGFALNEHVVSRCNDDAIYKDTLRAYQLALANL
jgi:L-malate glycosyltransferase